MPALYIPVATLLRQTLQGRLSGRGGGGEEPLQGRISSGGGTLANLCFQYNINDFQKPVSHILERISEICCNVIPSHAFVVEY